MALDKDILDIPLTGGLETSSGPLAQTPGTFLQLDDIRQERLHEWRNRQGITHNDSLDDIPGPVIEPPMLSAEVPNGTVIGLSTVDVVAGINDKLSSAMVYDRSMPLSGLPRWRRPVNYYDAPVAAPGIWDRTCIASEAAFIGQVSVAVGSTGMRLVAWQGPMLRYALITPSGKVLATGNAGSSVAQSPRATYEPVSGFFLLFYYDAGNLRVTKLSEVTAAFVTDVLLKNDVDTTGLVRIDALHYPGSTTVTAVYSRAAGATAKQLEVNPTTLALTADVALAVTSFHCISLLPDPDGSGTRFIGIGNDDTAVKVVRTTSVGAILTNDTVSSDLATQIIGCAYQGGTGWQIVYLKDDGSLWAAKRIGGVAGTASLLQVGSASGGASDMFSLDSNAWRAVGADTMHYILGLHVVSGGDYQNTYYEMALPYDSGSTAVANGYSVPQAVMIPLNAGFPLPAHQQPTQAIQSGNQFLVGLPRLSNPRITGAEGPASSWSADVWSVEYMSPSMLTSTRPNIGTGITGPQCAYLPAGLVLQSATGSTLWSHGATMLPRIPKLTPSAGVGLNSDQLYTYAISIDYPDELGNVWRGPLSIAATIKPTGGNLQVNINATLSLLDASTRRRIVNFWRTLGNGSVFQLVHQATADGSVAALVYVDAIPDTALATANFPPVGLEAGLTPAFRHMCFFDGRMWGAERDFPRRLRFSKKMQIGISPEFPPEFFVDLEDEFGDITGLAALDDKLIIGKDQAIYFTPEGTGPADDGSGGTYSVTRINAEIGIERGMPYISTGSHVWLFHHGVHVIDRSLHVEFVGEPIDRWFNQPLIVNPEFPICFNYNHRRDEVRMLTPNYRFVYDIDRKVWIRDTGGPAGTLLIQTLRDVGDMFIRSNGQVWWDYDIENISSTADASGPVQGFIKSWWMRLAKPEGYLRLYSTRTIWSREPGQSTTVFPVTTVYFNDDDNLNEIATPVGTSGVTKQTLETRTARQKCTSFAIGVELPAGDLRWRIAQWSVMYGIKYSQVQR